MVQENMMIEKKYSVPGISCQHCVNTIQTELGETDFVDFISADAGSKQVLVRFEDPEAESRILSLLDEIGYSVEEELS
jgi:copper chaperone